MQCRILGCPWGWWVLKTFSALTPSAFISYFSDIQFVVFQVREIQLELVGKNVVIETMRLNLMVSLTHLQPIINDRFREPYFSFWILSLSFVGEWSQSKMNNDNDEVLVYSFLYWLIGFLCLFVFLFNSWNTNIIYWSVFVSISCEGCLL